MTVLEGLLAAGKAGGVLGRAHRALEGLNTRRFEEARDEMFREWIALLHVAVASLEEANREKGVQEPSRDERADERCSDPQFAGVFMNYAYEAAREAIRERRRMLAYAAAGSLNVDLTVAEIGRIERKLRELDPEDVLLLGEIVDLNERAVPREYNENTSVAVLIAAGFLRGTWGWGCARIPGALVTPDGAHLHEIMRGYLNARGPTRLPADVAPDL